jgi:hypothetical protein
MTGHAQKAISDPNSVTRDSAPRILPPHAGNGDARRGVSRVQHHNRPLEDFAMRLAFPLLASLGLLAACNASPPQVAASPPSVSYQVTGSDVGQAGVKAQHYCEQFGRSAQFEGVQTTSSGDLATYNCASR